MKLISAIAVLVTISVAAATQDLSNIEYGKPDELRGVTKIFVLTKASKESRDEIAARIERELVGVTVTDASDGAEVILIYDGGHYGGSGLVFKIAPNGRARVLMDWKGSKGRIIGRDLEKKFAEAFIKAYRKANDGMSPNKPAGPKEIAPEVSLNHEEGGWEKISESSSSTMYYRPHDLVSTGSMRKVWIKVVFSTVARASYIESRLKLGKPIKGYENYSYSLNLQEYDCAKREFGLLLIADYDKERDMIGRTDSEETMEWEPVIPDTPIEKVFKTLCSGSK